MIKIELVSEKTFRAVINMELAEEQKKFVANNMYSLAQAWLYYDETKPFVILNDDTPVGFVMLDWDENERTVGIWRIMIDAKEQNKGYGREALEVLIQMVKDTNKFDLIHIDYVKDNRIARELYFSLGFRENGDIEGDEIVMTLPIAHHAKVGFTFADDEETDELLNVVSLCGETDLDEVFTDKEKLEEAMEDKKVVRFTLYGKAFALAINGRIVINPKFVDRLDEVKEVLERIENE